MNTSRHVRFVCSDSHNPSLVRKNCTGMVQATIKHKSFFGKMAVGKCPSCSSVKMQFVN